MTALSTTSPGIKPPTSIPQDTIFYHGQYASVLDDYLGLSGKALTGGGVPVTELDVTGSGYLQLLCAGNGSGDTSSINLTLSIDGSELYNFTQPNASVYGPIAVGALFVNVGGNEAAISLDAYRFETGFTVDVTTSGTQGFLTYKYYLDS